MIKSKFRMKKQCIISSGIVPVTCFLVVFCILLRIAPFSAYAVTQADIKELQKKKEELQAQLEEKQAIVDGLESQHAEVLERKQAMDERNMYTIQQIQINSEQIELYSQMIADKAKEVETAKQMEEEQLMRYRTRVRAMEERGYFDFLAALLRASDFHELLTMIDDAGEIMEYDRSLEDDYIAAREYTEQVKAEYEEYKAEIEAKQEELRAEQIELEAQIEEAVMLLYDLVMNIDSESEEVDALNVSIEEAQQKIDEMVAELERQRAAEEAAKWTGDGSGGLGSGAVSSNGTFIWPVPGCTYITSRYGPRYHPVTGLFQSSHAGLDINASTGTAIVAADGGTVTLAGVNGGYGNCVMIDHGNGYYTLYAHMSSIAVTKGMEVFQGATIGYVGSTGISTGPHCHFEIRENGATTDPAAWFSGLTYAPDA